MGGACKWPCISDQDQVSARYQWKINELQKEKEQLKKQLQVKTKKMEELEQANKSMPDSFRKQQLASQPSNINRLPSPINQMPKWKPNHDQEIFQLRSEIDRINIQMSQKDKEIIIQKAKNKQLTEKNRIIEQEMSSLKAKINANRNSQHSQSVPWYLVHRATKFFSGDVLNQFDDYKIYLTDTLEKEMGLTIKRTQLIFRYEKAFPRNLHQPVDGHSPLVVLLKTVKGYHIACVSQAPFVPRSKQQGRGWLISLTKGRVYRAAVGKQAILYDEMYLIFGNQEIRIDGSSNRVFSNFGISNSFYNTTGNDVRDFLGPGLEGTPREAELESFEVFRLQAE